MTRIVKHRAGLADFLKTRRARLHPEQFGLPTFPRRRTMGLRREELAQLVGIGISWYTWLEQGRDIQVSEQVLERLAHILQLDAEEQSHLFVLARGPVPPSDERGSELLLQNAAYQAISSSCCGRTSYLSILSEKERFSPSVLNIQQKLPLPGRHVWTVIVVLEEHLPRDVQRVKLKQKEEQQRSSGAGIVKKQRKVPLIDMRQYRKRPGQIVLKERTGAASAQAVASRSKPKEEAKVAGSP
jgi:transcriptional regulator with XRE-family HTH domain